jgi:phytoene dehydrogenase-like protein
VTNDGVYYYNTGTSPVNETEPLHFQKADVIVVNADLPYAEQSLLTSKEQHESKSTVRTDFNSSHHPLKGPPASTGHRMEQQHDVSTSIPKETRHIKYDWNDRYQFSSGVIAFHWSVNQSLEELNTHNVFLSASNRTSAYQSWNYVRNATLPTSSMMTNVHEPFNFYVHRASKTDPSAAPSVRKAFIIIAVLF